MESMPAVLVTGSTVKTMIVSVHRGQSSVLGSPPRKPKNTILIRLPPSHVGAWTCGARIVGVGLGPATCVPCGLNTGVWEAPELALQLAGGRPSSEVNSQQVTKPRMKANIAM